MWSPPFVIDLIPHALHTADWQNKDFTFERVGVYFICIIWVFNNYCPMWCCDYFWFLWNLQIFSWCWGYFMWRRTAWQCFTIRAEMRLSCVHFVLAKIGFFLLWRWKWVARHMLYIVTVFYFIFVCFLNFCLIVHHMCWVMEGYFQLILLPAILNG